MRISSIAQELTANRRQTREFIAARPSEIALIPRRRIKDGNGTKWIEETPRDSQMLRLIEQGPSASTAARGGDGVQRKTSYQLLGEWSAEIGQYDTWTDSAGIRWEIDRLLPDNGYERRAMVRRYGES